MTATRRWWWVVSGVVLLVAAPWLTGLGAGSAVDQPPIDLVRRVQASAETPYVGLVSTTGAVALPAAEGLGGVAKLLGEDTRVRVWWAGSQRWRTATLRPTGETDAFHVRGATVRWVYESKNATLLPDAPLRLPDTRDLLPPELARWALQGARPEELATIPGRRVAGHDTVGVRLTPDSPTGSVRRVDVYLDPTSGLPLSVAVYSRRLPTPSLESTFEDVRLEPPDVADLRFVPPEDAKLRLDRSGDLVGAALRAGGAQPPATLAGLPRRGGAGQSVGIYGRGPTALLALPLSGRAAGAIEQELGGRAVDLDSGGTLVLSPPLGLLLTEGSRYDIRWLLVGTLERDALEAAADELPKPLWFSG